MDNHFDRFWDAFASVAAGTNAVEPFLAPLSNMSPGRLFIIGNGGSAANASHAVNDFRKCCGIEAYAPADSVAELTARINDDGWEEALAGWLATSRIGLYDVLLVLSVGGGSVAISTNLVKAARYAKSRQAVVLGIFGRPDGLIPPLCDASIVTAVEDADLQTPVAEAYQSLILHMLTSHPGLRCAT